MSRFFEVTILSNWTGKGTRERPFVPTLIRRFRPTHWIRIQPQPDDNLPTQCCVLQLKLTKDEVDQMLENPNVFVVTYAPIEDIYVIGGGQTW